MTKGGDFVILKRRTMFDKVNDKDFIEENSDIEAIDYEALMEISDIFEEYTIGEELTLAEAFVDNFKSEKLQNFKAKLESEKDLKNQWEKLGKMMVTNKWITRYVNPQQEAMIQKYLDIMNKEDVKWTEYRLAFVQICKFFGLNNRETVIEWLEFQDKGNEGRVAACRYSKGLARVNIPPNIRLTHFSPVDKLTELQPTFKSKKAGKFFYSSPRVYFTIKEKLNPFKFGVDRHVTRICYQTVDYISTAYIDPTYILFKDRCVYVDTVKPIRVQRVGTASGRNILTGVKKDKGV